MKKIALVLAPCLLVSACLPSLEFSDENIQRTLPFFCQSGLAAHLVFLRYADRVSDSIRNGEAQAAQSLKLICADSENATTTSVLIRASSAAAIILAARKEATNG